MAENQSKRSWTGVGIVLATLIFSVAYSVSHRYQRIGTSDDHSLVFVDQWTGQAYMYGREIRLRQIHKVDEAP